MKTLYIIAGANGSGKTTFASQFASQENIKFINADEQVADTHENYDDTLLRQFLEGADHE